MRKTEADLVVIGGGAAGMFAAAQAGDQGRRVVLLERNTGYTGKKLRITGKGRCNLTNNCTPQDVLDQILTNRRFMTGAINRFPPAAVMAYFESLGVALKTERGGRVFPESDQALDVVYALRRALQRAGVRVIYDRARAILTDGTSVAAVRGETVDIACAAAIVCTGGVSYPATGSTGDGYELAATLGHSIVPPKPSLVPLCCSDACCAQMQGLSLRNVRLTVRNENGAQVFSDFGEMLFTHFGISGPVVLSASSYIGKYQGKELKFMIDLKPALNKDQLDHRVLKDFNKALNKDFVNSLDNLLPKKLIPVIVELSGIPEHKKVNEITKKERETLVSLLKRLELTITGVRGFKEAIITQGGVNVKEIDPGTMESKKVKGLYFAGEVLDLDAVTGGFNLQIAWSTGYLAGMN